eukprot:TRINITY_DN18986_c0_g1_i1.p1 TRINITY_DN18986_c0_g1~~TRINITY_DN18986_c0_g1_i1.p1  ORF type:complete len:286 (+),score=48.62 TRINITY_DN18986_c0_g1_i1:228-1085(+)
MLRSRTWLALPLFAGLCFLLYSVAIATLKSSSFVPGAVENRIHELEESVAALETHIRRAHFGWENCLRVDYHADCTWPDPDPRYTDGLPCRTELLWELLQHTDDVLRTANVTYWLAFGSLLGAVRHQRLISWTGDVDVVYLNTTSDQLLRRIHYPLLRRGIFTFLEVGLLRVCLSYNNRRFQKYARLVIDPEDRRYSDMYPYMDIYAGRLVNNTHVALPMNCLFDVDVILPTTTLEVYGRPMPVPRDPIRYLNRTYGPGFMEPPPLGHRTPHGDSRSTCQPAWQY